MRRAIFVLIVTLGAMAQAQQLAPTPEEKMRLELKQKTALLDVARVQILELQLAAARSASAQSYDALKREGAMLIEAHKWSASFDPQSLEFAARPPMKDPAPKTSSQ